MKKPRKLYVPGVLKGKLQGAIRRSRRETIYKMLSKRHDGVVPCFCCTKHVEPKDATLEHIVELSNGGTDAMANLSISHGICNFERSHLETAVNYSAVSGQLNATGIDINADFHTLPSSQVEVLVTLAKENSYRKPKNANGSTARHYFEALHRQYVRERK